ncbi:MAG: hypothetical protein Q4C78_06450 [Synergistaceae bacterium]|nr:hypothetical protein [Synergistaceae bacterium]
MIKNIENPLLPSLTSFFTSLLCIALGFVLGFFILFAISPSNAFEGFTKILQGGFYMYFKLGNTSGLSRIISQTPMLILGGLSVAIAYKAGLFNIGVTGQYIVGGLGAIYSALVLHLPWYICTMVAALFGAIWGVFVGYFKAYFNVSEIISAIMLNWIALFFVNQITYSGAWGDMFDPAMNATYILAHKAPSSMIPNLGMAKFFNSNTVTIAIFIAIIFAVIVHILISKTTFGYELQACGLGKDAAKYAGINDKRTTIYNMAIAGALAGIAAATYFLSDVDQWHPQISSELPDMIANSIPVALLAMCNPIGVIFAALLVVNVSVGATYLNTKFFQPEIGNLTISVIIYLCAFVAIFKDFVENFLKRRR